MDLQIRYSSRVGPILVNRQHEINFLTHTTICVDNPSALQLERFISKSNGILSYDHIVAFSSLSLRLGLLGGHQVQVTSIVLSTNQRRWTFDRFTTSCVLVSRRHQPESLGVNVHWFSLFGTPHI
jgi:hypothetical protein